jgi:hypothetical protein
MYVGDILSWKLQVSVTERQENNNSDYNQLLYALGCSENCICHDTVCLFSPVKNHHPYSELNFLFRRLYRQLCWVHIGRFEYNMFEINTNDFFKLLFHLASISLKIQIFEKYTQNL